MLPIATVIAFIVLAVAAQDENVQNCAGTQTDSGVQRTLEESVRQRERYRGRFRYGSRVMLYLNGSYGVLEDPDGPDCKDYCLNGARCIRVLPQDNIVCHCRIQYSGASCETRRSLECPAVDPTPDATCEGTPCSLDNQCDYPREKCCLNECGGTECRRPTFI